MGINKINRIPVFIFIFILTLAFAVGISYTKLFPNNRSGSQVSSNTNASIFAELQLYTQQTRSFTISPNNPSQLIVSTPDNVSFVVDIPNQAVKTDTNVVVVPYRAKGSTIPGGIQILPHSLVFAKPVTVTALLEASTFRIDVPKTRSETLRISGATQMLGSVQKQKAVLPLLVSYTTETPTRTSARIFTGGRYVFTLDGKNQSAYAVAAITDENASVFSVVSGALSLLNNSHQFSKQQRTIALQAAQKIIANPLFTGFEQVAAFAIFKHFNQTPSFSLIPRVFASDDVVADYFRSQCGRDNLIAEQYWSFADNALLYRHSDIAQHCREKAQEIVRKETEEILSKPNATIEQIIAQWIRADEFSIAEEYDKQIRNALKSKHTETVNTLLQKIESATPFTPGEYKTLISKIQQAMAVGTQTGMNDTDATKLQDKLSQLAYEWALLSINNSSMTVEDRANILQQAQMMGVTDKQAAELLEKLNDRSNWDGNDVLSNPNSTKAELWLAWDRETDPQLKQKLYDRFRKLRDAEADKKALEDFGKTRPKPTPTAPDAPPPEFIFDWGIIGPAAVNGFLGAEYTEEGIKELAGTLDNEFAEMLGELTSFCKDDSFITDNIPNMQGIADIKRDYDQVCQDLESGQKQAELDEQVDVLEQYAQEVGDNQQEYDQEETDKEYHIEIEITPTPEQRTSVAEPENETETDEQSESESSSQEFIEYQ